MAVNCTPFSATVALPLPAQADTAINNSGALPPGMAGETRVETLPVISTLAPLSWGLLLANPWTSKMHPPTKVLLLVVLTVMLAPLLAALMLAAYQISTAPPLASLP